MKKAIIFLLVLSMMAVVFLPSCTDTETPGPGDDTTTSPDDPVVTDPSNTTTLGGVNSDDPDGKTVEEVIAEIDELTNKRIDEIKNTKDDINVKGTIYYVSADGNDSNNGKSPEKAWKTMDKVASKRFSSGDAVLFRRGDTFRGNFKAQDGVTYAAYGEGDKPILIASEITDGAEASSWSLLEGTTNIWVYHKEVGDQGCLFFKDGDVESYAYKVTPSYKNGNWYVAWTSNRVAFNVAKNLENNLEFVCLADSKLTSKGLPDVENHPEDCVGELYLRCDEGNPAEVFDSIEFAPRVFTINAYANNVTIDNLCFKYTGAHAVGGGNCTGLTVTNCEVGWIGGTIQFYRTDSAENLFGQVVRYGNAIQAIGDARNYTAKNNYVYQVYDAGITHQVGEGGGVMRMENITYSDNVILYCTYSIEYFLGKKTDSSSTRYMANVVIENNIMRYAGFGFGNQRGDKENAAHIKGWHHANYLKDGTEFVIRNNILDRSRYMMIHCGAEKVAYLPTFEDNIWIQYRTGTSSLGKFGIDSTARERQFTERNFNALAIEKDPEFYTIDKKDWLWDIPAL